MELELEPLNFPSDQERPCVIAGPCSAETEEQVMTTARQLAAKGCHMLELVYGSLAPNQAVLREMVRLLCLG